MVSSRKLASRPRTRKIAGHPQGGQAIPTSWQDRSTDRRSPARLQVDPVPETRPTSAVPWSVPKTHTGEEGQQQGCGGRLLVTPGGNLSLRMVLLWDVRLVRPCPAAAQAAGIPAHLLVARRPGLRCPHPRQQPGLPPALPTIRAARSPAPCRGLCATNVWSSRMWGRRDPSARGCATRVPKGPRVSVSKHLGRAGFADAAPAQRSPFPLWHAQPDPGPFIQGAPQGGDTPGSVRTHRPVTVACGTVASRTVHMDLLVGRSSGGSACNPGGCRLSRRASSRGEQAGTSLRHACGSRAYWRAAARNRGFFTADARSASAGEVGPRQPEKRVCRARAILLATENSGASGRGSHREGQVRRHVALAEVCTGNGTDGLLRGKSAHRASLPSRGRGMRRLPLGAGAALPRVNAIGACRCVGHRPGVSGRPRTGCGRRMVWDRTRAGLSSWVVGRPAPIAGGWRRWSARRLLGVRGRVGHWRESAHPGQGRTRSGSPAILLHVTVRPRVEAEALGHGVVPLVAHSRQRG